MSEDLLSRLLSGELSPAEEAELLARIAADPALAARWEAMQALSRDLGRLPREIPPPPHLLRKPLPAARPRRAWAGWLAAGLAAAVALAALLPRDPPTIALSSGIHTVEGEVTVLTADARIDVDGIVSVRVEPPPGALRELGAEDNTMNISHALAALAGSVVTVAVLEGSAIVRAGDGEPVALAAGETRTVRGASAPVTETPAADRPKRAVSVQDVLDMSDEEIAALNQALEQAGRENALLSGQLRMHEGVPQDWPADLVPQLRPEAFEAGLRAAMAGVEGAELLSLDCDEYPCIAVLRSQSKAEDWEEDMAGIHERMAENGGLPEDIHVMGSAQQMKTDTADVRLYGFSITQGEQQDPDLRTRQEFRTRSLMEDLGTELAGER